MEDHGIGIRNEDLPRLFTEFGQLCPREKARNGSGLGLAITRRIVEALGGSVGVESLAGRGSRFYALVPDRLGVAGPAMLEIVMDKVRILVAENNLAYQSALFRMLSGWGYEVILASSGSEAWCMLRANGGPTLAILSSALPGMDGVEVCRQVPTWMAGSQYVYILLLAGKADVDDVVSPVWTPAPNDYITWPFHSQELRARLRAACRILKLPRTGSSGLGKSSTSRQRATASPVSGTASPCWKSSITRSRARGRSGESVALLMLDLDNFKQMTIPMAT